MVMGFGNRKWFMVGNSEAKIYPRDPCVIVAK
jgi:hypothetical protein